MTRTREENAADEAQEAAVRESTDDRLVNLLWDYLKRDPEHKDRRQTGFGTKTKMGLTASIRRILQEGE
jgi:hypothetical protein